MVKENTLQNLTPEQIAELKNAFQLFDKDGDGKLTESEIYALCRISGKGYSIEAARQLVRVFDIDGDGRLDLNEFLILMNQLPPSAKGSSNHDELYEAFKVFDTNGDGKISVDELILAFQRLGDPITREDALVMIREVDTDGDNQVNFVEFKRLMRQDD